MEDSTPLPARLADVSLVSEGAPEAMPLCTEDRDRASALIRSGDAERIAEYFYPMVRSFVRSIVRRDWPDVIETATGDALLAISWHGQTFRGDASPATWIYQIARRKAWVCMRRETAYRARYLLTDNPAVRSGIHQIVNEPPDPCARRIALETLAAAVPKDSWRRVWILANDPDLQFKGADVAAATGYSEGSVAVIKSRVRKQLRQLWRTKPRASAPCQGRGEGCRNTAAQCDQFTVS